MQKNMPGTAGWRRGMFAVCAAVLLAPCAAQADIAVPDRPADRFLTAMDVRMQVQHWDAATGKPVAALPPAAEALDDGGGAWLRRSTPELELSLPGPCRWTWTLSKDGAVLASGAGSKTSTGTEKASAPMPQAALCGGGCSLDAVFVPLHCADRENGEPSCHDGEDAGVLASMRLETDSDGVLLQDGTPVNRGIPLQSKVVAAKNADGVPEMKTVPWRGPLPPGVPEMEGKQ